MSKYFPRWKFYTNKHNCYSKSDFSCSLSHKNNFIKIFSPLSMLFSCSKLVSAPLFNFLLPEAPLFVSLVSFLLQPSNERFSTLSLLFLASCCDFLFSVVADFAESFVFFEALPLAGSAEVLAEEGLQKK